MKIVQNDGYARMSRTQEAPKESAVTLSMLTVCFCDVTAIDGLSLSVPRGSLFGFLGANGAGKTTTLNCLSGLQDLSGGSIELLGRPFDRSNVDARVRLGVLPESLALFDQLYVSEFLYFQARMFRLDKAIARARIAELAEALAIGDKPRTRLADLSAGTRKKIAFAAAILHRPDLLLLDEPFESVDATSVALMKEWLRVFVGRGGTVFLTSHVLETVEKLCDRVAIIDHGRLAWEGSPRGPLVLSGREFEDLESLFLGVTGERQSQLGWL